MRVLFCIDTYFPSRGGAEGYLRDLADALARKGHEVTVACVESDDSFSPAVIPVRLPPGPRLLREMILARVPGKMIARGGFDAVVAFRHALKADIFQPHGGLHIESLKGAARSQAGRTGAPAFLLLLKKFFSPKNLFFLWCDRVLLGSGPKHRVAALSAMTAGPVEKRLGCPVAVIHNGVDTGRFHPGLRERYRHDFLRKEKIPHGSDVVLFCGHNFRLKGLAQALRGLAAFHKKNSRIIFLVVGRERARRYERLAKDLGLSSSVRFLGERHDMERLYGASDVLLHPTWYDPCSLVALEALGAGVPVVTTKYNGASELMTQGREGFVLDDPGDADATARFLAEVLGSERERFRKNAASLGRKNHFGLHVDRFERLLFGLNKK